MKTILIVEDTQANLDAAKAFFSTVSDNRFVYAVNRKEAEELMDSVDGVISDRDLPYEERVRTNELENGYAIIMNAKGKGLPAVLVSEHGRLNIFTAHPKHRYFESTFNHASHMIGRKFDFANKGDVAFIDMFPGIYESDHVVTAQGFVGISKTSPAAWQMAWQELQKQF
ncbi:MAG: hypothetical protein WDN09_02630 [bacterium]